MKHRLVPIYQHLTTRLQSRPIPEAKDRPKAYLLLIPDYGNVGDLAIAYSMQTYVKRYLPRHVVYTIHLRDTYKHLKSIREQAQAGDVVFLVGGGSMGDLYPRAQLGREFVAGYLRGMPMVSFPQSVIYTSLTAREGGGRREARNLGRHHDLTLCARERKSLEVMKSHFRNAVIFAPDIVFSLLDDIRSLPPVRREWTTLVLRSDAERARSESDDGLIREAASSLGAPVVEQDHALPNSELRAHDLASHVWDMINQYRCSRLVITDRLHGMIFAAVTGTPCVVVANTNHKIEGTFRDWIQHQCGYIAFLSNLDRQSLAAAISQVSNPAVAEDYGRVNFDFSELNAQLQRFA